MITSEDIKEKLKGFDDSQLKEAVSIQNKLQFFAIPYTESVYAPAYETEFKEKIFKKISNKKAYNTFIENITYPLPTVEFIGTVYTSLGKIFDGDGKNIAYIPEDGSKYEQPTFDYFKNDAWNRYQIAPNTFVVTNRKADGTIYRHFVDVTTVKYIDLNDDESIESFMYDCGKKRIWIDKESIITLDDKGNIIEDESIDHEFGFCPVDFLSNRKLSYKKNIIRINPLVNSLGDIEEFLTVSIQANMINKHIIPYVVEVKKTGNAAGCDYHVGDTYCQNGYLYQSQVSSDGSESTPINLLDKDRNASKCPICNTETGFGSLLEIPANDLNADEFAKVSDSIIAFKALGIESLGYPAVKKKELKTEIYNQIVNKQEQLNNNQQQNEIRVAATRDDMLSVIFREKGIFEVLWESLTTKSIKIQLPSYVSTEVSLGNKFFLKSGEQYQDLITKNKENGNNDLLDDEKNLISVNYSENQTAKGRYLFILELEKAGKPMRNLSTEQVVDLYKNGDLLDKDFDLNVNFFNRIRQVELDKNEQVQNMFIESDLNIRIKKVLELIVSVPNVISSTATVTKE